MIHFLCVTNRPQWRPWLKLQWSKISNGNKLTVLENTARTIGECRQQLLEESDPAASHVAFIDDDDWQNPMRGGANRAEITGSRSGYKVNPITGRARLYASHELVIFNGSVVERSLAMRCRFPPVDRAEDTAWIEQLARNMRYGAKVIPQHLSAWMCHGKNVTNRSSLLTFESAPPSYISRQELELAAECARV